MSWLLKSEKRKIKIKHFRFPDSSSKLNLHPIQLQKLQKGLDSTVEYGDRNFVSRTLSIDRILHN